MRKDWEYKKLGDIAENKLSYGSGASAIPFDKKTRYIRITDIDDSGNLKENTVSPNVVEDKYLLSDGDILFARSGATVGKTFLYKEKYGECIYAGYLIRLVPNQQLVLPEYVYYYTQSHYYKSFVESNKKVVAQPNINAQQYTALQIPLPPKSTQLSIVAELDKLNEMIRLKKQQLEDYDQLAQSIFYEMFGDPVENEKGWEVKKLEEAVATSCTISYGIVQPGEHVLNGVPVVRPVDLGNTFVKTTDLKCTTVDISNNYSRTILTGDEILVCVRGTTGIVSLATSELKGCNVTRGITPLLFDINNKWFMYAQFKTASIQHIIASNTKGIALKQINMGDLRNIRIILPPLPLQQQFAARIEAIEQQKQQVKDTIKDLETLLASRMQYWFDS